MKMNEGKWWKWTRERGNAREARSPTGRPRPYSFGPKNWPKSRFWTSKSRFLAVKSSDFDWPKNLRFLGDLWSPKSQILAIFPSQPNLRFWPQKRWQAVCPKSQIFAPAQTHQNRHFDGKLVNFDDFCPFSSSKMAIFEPENFKNFKTENFWPKIFPIS